MNFRDFVEQTRDALQSLAFTLTGDRDLTPMLHLESDDTIDIVGIDPVFFDSSDQTRLLITKYVLPLIAENHPQKVAWTYCAWAAPEFPPSESAERREILAAVFIDPEVVEHWTAPIVRTGGQVILGQWDAVQDASGGRMITEIQQALR